MVIKLFKIKFTDDIIVNETGLAMIGKLLNDTRFRVDINNKSKLKNTSELMPNYDIMAAYIGCLAQAKPEFVRVEEYRKDMFFKNAMMLDKKVPSECIVRQRLDAIGKEDMGEFKRIVARTNVELLTNSRVKLTSRYKELIPVDIDVSPHDNSNTKKEGVEYTYKGYFGYAPIYAYIGNEGYLLNLELREGKEHSQCSKTIPFLKDTIEMAKEIIKGNNVLFTLDSGHSCTENIELFENENVKYIIKKNNQKDRLQDIFEEAKKRYNEEQESKEKLTEKEIEQYKGTVNKVVTRDGKEYYITSVEKIKYLKNNEGKETATKVRVVRECIKRTIDKKGQVLIAPEYEIKQYYTNLDNEVTDEEVIELYHKHAICEQFHSEIKSDMDLERLPSGKFNTNEIVLKLAQLTFNILRMIGQANVELHKDGLNIQRKRIRTVIKDIVYFASRIVKHARKEYISISKKEFFKDTFHSLFNYFCYE